MFMLWSILFGLFLLGMLLSAFIMGIVAISMLPQSHSGRPTIAVNSGAGFANLSFSAASRDYAGLVRGQTTNAAGSVNVTFGRRYQSAPKAVTVTPTTATAYTTPLEVENVTSNGFTVRGAPTTTLSGIPYDLFYYTVIA